MEVRWNVYESFEALLQARPYHLILEGILIICILWLLIKRPSQTKKIKLTKKEEEDLLSEWIPEPLVPTIPPERESLLVSRVIQGKVGKYININGKKLLNMGTHSYLNMDERPEIEANVLETVNKYGIGSCGPRGFYGTTEVHLILEDRLAKFYGCESAALYSYGFSTIASAIPAYSKKGDVIYADECVNFAIQRGLQASRSTVYYFKHNDMKDLAEMLETKGKMDKKNPKKAAATRCFLVVESIYLNTGTICPLPELVALRQKHKIRLFIDESVSFGTLGDNARGITDHFQIPMKEIDLIMVSLEYACATNGGFTVGTNFVIEHQRLSGLGYCFSAALPPLLAAAAIKVVDILEEEGADLVVLLQEKCKFAHTQFSQISNKFTLKGDPIIPVKHLAFKERLDSRKAEEEMLRKIVQIAENQGVAVVSAVYLDSQEYNTPAPSIRLTICKNLTEDEIKLAANVLKFAIKDVLPH